MIEIYTIHSPVLIFRASRMREREEKKLEKMRRKERKRIKMERKERRKNNPRKADHCKVVRFTYCMSKKS